MSTERVVRKTGAARGRAGSGAPGEDAPRKHLLEAASRLFAQHGFEGVSTAMVAEAAELTQSMVHYHFQSKALMWEEVVRHLMRQRRQFFPISSAFLVDIEPIIRLKMFVRSLFEINIQEPQFNMIFLHESLSQGPRYTWLMDRYVGKVFKTVDAMMAEAVAAGQARRFPDDHMSNIIMSPGALVLAFQTISRSIYHIDIPRDDYIRALSDTFVSLIFDGLTPRVQPGDGGPA
ncbi:MAG: TetR/AcrR family transcriptional regulator [Sphingobium sp.]